MHHGRFFNDRTLISRVQVLTPVQYPYNKVSKETTVSFLLKERSRNTISICFLNCNKQFQIIYDWSLVLLKSLNTRPTSLMVSNGGFTAQLSILFWFLFLLVLQLPAALLCQLIFYSVTFVATQFLCLFQTEFLSCVVTSPIQKLLGISSLHNWMQLF